MHITNKVNKSMKTYTWIILFFATLLLSSITVAQESEEEQVFWGNKPVECYPLQQALKLAQDAGMQSAFGGLGIIDFETDEGLSEDTGFVFLMVNLETSMFVVMEVDKTKTACLIAKGNNVEFDPTVLDKMTRPSGLVIQ